MQLWQSPPPLRMAISNPHHRPQTPYRHSHRFYELALVLAGDCTWHLSRRRRVTVPAGGALLLAPHVMHHEEVAPPQQAHLAWLGFDFEGAAPAWCQQLVALGDDAPEAAGYFDIIVRERQLSDPRGEARIGFALQSLLLLLERRAEGSPGLAEPRSGLNRRQAQIADAAAHYFQHNLRDTLSIAQVAAYHSLCPAHFSLLFRQQHRVSPRTFLRRARVQRGADLLAGSELTIKEIAGLCGFVDAPHFCKSFREARRMTPGNFRRKIHRRPETHLK